MNNEQYTNSNTRQITKSLFENAKQHRVATKLKDEAAAATYYSTIRDTLGMIPSPELSKIMIDMREQSIAVNGQEPITTNGYGLVREVYADVLGHRLMDSAKQVVQAKQSGNPDFLHRGKLLEEEIQGEISALPLDQAIALQQAEIQPEPGLNTMALNRFYYAKNYVNEVLANTVSLKQEEAANFDQVTDTVQEETFEENLLLYESSII